MARQDGRERYAVHDRERSRAAENLPGAPNMAGKSSPSGPKKFPQNSPVWGKKFPRMGPAAWSDRMHKYSWSELGKKQACQGNEKRGFFGKSSPAKTRIVTGFFGFWGIWGIIFVIVIIHEKGVYICPIYMGVGKKFPTFPRV